MMKKLDYIDSLRGIAVIAVLLVHCKLDSINQFPGSIKSIILSGGRGVQLFYVISAFTLFLSYSKRASIENNINLNFYIRRFFRIAPMYYLAIIYYLLQYKLDSDLSLEYEKLITNWNITSNVFFLHGLSPYWINSLVPGGWSIAVEVLFYSFMPFLFKIIKNINQALIFF